MRACTSEPASPHVDITRGGREGVGDGEHAPIFFFLWHDYVDEVFPGMARFILHIGAGARVNNDNVK